MKKIFILLLFLPFYSSFAEDLNNYGKPGFSVFFTYPVVFFENEELPYPYGLGGGIDIDFAGKIPLLNLAGFEFSGNYSFLDLDDNNQDENYHYFSTGFGLYLRTAFHIPVNAGIRTGAGSGWIIQTKMSQETGNNQRMNGLYTFIAPFIEIKSKTSFYFQAGLEYREQNIDHKPDDEQEGDNRDDDRVRLNVFYLRTGFRY